MAIFDQIWPLIEADTASTLEEKIPGFKYEVFTGKAIYFVCFDFSGRYDSIVPTGKKTDGRTDTIFFPVGTISSYRPEIFDERSDLSDFSGRYNFIVPTGNF